MSGFTVQDRERKKVERPRVHNASAGSAGRPEEACGKLVVGEEKPAARTPNSQRGNQSNSSPPRECEPDLASRSGHSSQGVDESESPASADGESEGYDGVALPSDFGGEFFSDGEYRTRGDGNPPERPEGLGGHTHKGS